MRRSLIWPEATSPNSKATADASVVNDACVFVRCRRYCQVDVERANLSRRADFLCSHRTAQVTSLPDDESAVS